MRTGLLLLIPGVLLGGLIYGALKLSDLASQQKPCSAGQCPLALHKSDSGQTFIYPVATRFDVTLAEIKDPQSNLRCIPEGVIRPRQFITSGPLYTASFEAVTPGTCMLSDNDFSATIVIQ